MSFPFPTENPALGSIDRRLPHFVELQFQASPGLLVQSYENFTIGLPRTMWPWVITYGDPILGRMNTHVPPILMFIRGTGF